MQAIGWHCVTGAGGFASINLNGRTMSEIESDAERKSCNAFRVAVDGGWMTFRKLAGEWVQTA